MVNAPITTTAVSGMPVTQAGVAAAVASTSRQVGGSLGVAVIGAVVAAGIGSFAEASHAGWWIVFGCGVAVLALGLLTTGRWARSTADHLADRVAPPESPQAVGRWSVRG
jgi:hypothetical protein